MTKSWKTTLAGALVLLGVVIAQANNVLDENPETVFSWEAVIGAVGVFIMGLFARDKNVSSEQEGIK